MITQETLKQYLSYDPETGLFTWIHHHRPRVKIGAVAGCLHHTGYVLIKLSLKRYMAHRLAWLYVYGELPSGVIDHKDRNKSNNKLSNLRMADRSQNAYNRGMNANNKTGFKGVFYATKDKKFTAAARVSGKSHFIGNFNTAEEASNAYKEFTKIHHGEFAYD